jgi:benzoyl-CoA reductase/2-hydroxyglutaryl-CoA dehydratase subunit BcrC/BadD/HgdB
VPALPAIAARAEVIRHHRQQGGQVAAVLPVHAPRALLRAYGFLPVEVWGPPGVRTSDGASHLQPYVCSIVRNALSFLLSGGLDATDLILVPHACDSLQGLGSILLDFIKPRQPVVPLYFPRSEGAGAHRFLAEELRRVATRMGEITSRAPAADEILQYVVDEETGDRLLLELHETRRQLPLNNADFYRLVRSREYLPREAFETAARQALAMRHPDSAPGKTLLLSGVVPEPTSLMAALDERQVQIVADDTLCSRRRVCPPGRSSDPFERLSQSWLGGPPDSTRGSSMAARSDYLVRQVAASGACGVIFYLVKFCEPELFYLPTLRKALQRKGVPSVVLEVDLNDALSQQMLTRLDALLEMIP